MIILILGGGTWVQGQDDESASTAQATPKLLQHICFRTSEVRAGVGVLIVEYVLLKQV